MKSEWFQAFQSDRCVSDSVWFTVKKKVVALIIIFIFLHLFNDINVLFEVERRGRERELSNLFSLFHHQLRLIMQELARL